MKTNLLRICVIGAIAAAAAVAQSSTLKAYVPFDFIVGCGIRGMAISVPN